MKRISQNVAACLVRIACAALFATPAFAQQPRSQPVPSPHGLTTQGGATVGSGISDTVITAKAKAALLGAKDVHGSRIQVTTEQGVVTLAGVVPRAEEKDRATRVVADLDGVVSVNNALDVDAASK